MATAENTTPPTADPSDPSTTINLIFQMFGGGSSSGSANVGNITSRVG
ncbi:hypothetical protein G4X40_07675 [Rhodococcus sp. D2-41]|uniref:Uncharacterized protein n=1 Tax=Speluncibacter jeojiensis TaxID=2710754 RepID=A0A9X4M3C4_9ACTN|nr:hypothetical protein [Rhodococcus sp. D2-41]MDG3010026.1 hypothetical protein [Rhodococcus sp. D2-41]MDG3016270.1 hypothetical protein [Corynebacteriales bacterium D3-21]